MALSCRFKLDEPLVMRPFCLLLIIPHYSHYSQHVPVQVPGAGWAHCSPQAAFLQDRAEQVHSAAAPRMEMMLQSSSIPKWTPFPLGVSRVFTSRWVFFCFQLDGLLWYATTSYLKLCLLPVWHITLIFIFQIIPWSAFLMQLKWILT